MLLLLRVVVALRAVLLRLFNGLLQWIVLLKLRLDAGGGVELRVLPVRLIRIHFAQLLLQGVRGHLLAIFASQLASMMAAGCHRCLIVQIDYFNGQR